MAESRTGTQLPLPEGVSPDQVAQAFEQGIELGKVWMQDASVKLKAWAEENPGQFVIAGVVAGFVLGKILFPSRRRSVIDG